MLNTDRSRILDATCLKSLEIIGHKNITSIYDSVIQSAPALDYNDIMRNPKKYDNYADPTTYYTGFSGKVFQVIDDDEFLIDTSSGIVFVRGDSIRDYESNKILEGDYVSIFGEIDGTYSYYTLLWQEKTVPEITAIFIK